MRLSVARVIVGLVLAVATPALLRAAVAQADDPWNGRWSVSESTRDGQPVLVRRNTTAASLAADPRFPELLTVTVPLPKGADYTAATDLGPIETLLVDALEPGHKAIGVLVLTTDGARDFVFYTSDGAWAAGVVETLRAKALPYELKIHTSTDRRWELYASFEASH